MVVEVEMLHLAFCRRWITRSYSLVIGVMGDPLRVVCREGRW